MAAARRFGRPMLAAIAFAGHTPGLKIMARCRFTPWLVRINVVAALLTVGAMVAAGVLAAPGGGPMAVLVAWLIGHFAWSLVFSAWILAGGAIADPEG